MRVVLLAMLAVGAGSCAEEDGVNGYQRLSDHVAGNQVGYGADHWIEIKNLSAEWERTGLIFGYQSDYDECLKAIRGLQEANPGREYRCVPAN